MTTRSELLSDGARNIVSNSTVNTYVDPPRPQNEGQYTREAAYSMIAYKNQGVDGDSELHSERRNFENKYQLFLMSLGQYSNVALRAPTPTGFGEKLVYPITNDTPVFSSFRWLKPTNPEP